MDVQAGAGLVEQQSVGILDQGLGEQHELPFAAGQAAESSICHRGEPHVGEHAPRPGNVIRAFVLESAQVRIPAHQKDLHHSEGKDLRKVLRHERHTARAAAAVHVRDGPPVQQDFSGARRPHSRQQPQESGLAGPVRANDADQLPALDRDVQAVDDRGIPCCPREAPGPQERFTHRAPVAFRLWMRMMRLSR